MRRLSACALLFVLFASAAGAQRSLQRPDSLAAVPDLAALVGRPGSELVNVVSRYSTDYSSVTRRYEAANSPDQRQRMREFLAGWRAKLRAIDFDKLSQDGVSDEL